MLFAQGWFPGANCAAEVCDFTRPISRPGMRELKFLHSF